jgi:hypothetical protein
MKMGNAAAVTNHAHRTSLLMIGDRYEGIKYESDIHLLHYYFRKSYPWKLTQPKGISQIHRKSAQTGQEGPDTPTR